VKWASAPGQVRIGHSDIRDRDAVVSAMRGVDVVFHQAALRITQCAEDPRRAFEVMVDGTFNVLEAARVAGVRKVVAASSASVYGAAETFPIPEGHPASDRLTLYSAAKTFNEALLHSFQQKYGLDYVALRYFNVYGPRMDIEGPYTEVMVRWMERISQGLRPLILGDGQQTMDFVYVSDVASANIVAATSQVTDQVFNIATGIETSLSQLASMLLSAMRSGLEPQYGPARAVNNLARSVGDTRKARDLLGFNAEVSLSEGLKWLVEWWRRVQSSPKAVEAPAIAIPRN
jgi:UDP-glucose 4-epimerase